MKFRAFTEYHLELYFFPSQQDYYISVGKPSGRIFMHFLQGKGCHTDLMTNFFLCSIHMREDYRLLQAIPQNPLRK